ncbi:hypothetical protein PoB_001598900 [Plakobranchus ocellatus]|uniref:Uncharacterized protein n=1 Tax=Plakobranchus ocellatus TaxID=259542 RepID=A0AAV3Z655_9GAST|nr:hypothetical protein PoB_001598900 [Plakobranchus ocellatus]
MRSAVCCPTSPTSPEIASERSQHKGLGFGQCSKKDVTASNRKRDDLRTEDQGSYRTQDRKELNFLPQWRLDVLVLVILKSEEFFTMHARTTKTTAAPSLPAAAASFDGDGYGGGGGGGGGGGDGVSVGGGGDGGYSGQARRRVSCQDDGLTVTE